MTQMAERDMGPAGTGRGRDASHRPSPVAHRLSCKIGTHPGHHLWGVQRLLEPSRRPDGVASPPGIWILGPGGTVLNSLGGRHRRWHVLPPGPHVMNMSVITSDASSQKEAPWVPVQATERPLALSKSQTHGLQSVTMLIRAFSGPPGLCAGTLL